MAEKFVPFSQRMGTKQPFELEQGAPAHIRNLLEPAIENCFYARDGYSGITENAAALMSRMILQLRLPISQGDDYERYRSVCAQLRDDDVFLEVLDFLIFREKLPAKIVEDILEMGGSAYAVVNGRLTMRVDATLTDLVANILSHETKASEHLSDAWQKAYGMSPDPHGAWSAATRAVEELLKPVTIPKDDRFTMSKAVKAIEAKPEKWVFDLGGQIHGKGIDVFVGMLKLMFPEPAHHGGNGEDGPTLAEAHAAVTLATTLVQWLRSGAFRLAESNDANHS